jgi:hypothetical protein
MDKTLPATSAMCGDVMKHFISGNAEIEADIMATGEDVLDGDLRRARHYPSTVRG